MIHLIDAYTISRYISGHETKKIYNQEKDSLSVTIEISPFNGLGFKTKLKNYKFIKGVLPKRLDSIVDISSFFRRNSAARIIEQDLRR